MIHHPCHNKNNPSAWLRSYLTRALSSSLIPTRQLPVPVPVLIPGSAHRRVEEPADEQEGVGGRHARGAAQVELPRLAQDDGVCLGVHVSLGDAGLGFELEGEDEDLGVVVSLVGWMGAEERGGLLTGLVWWSVNSLERVCAHRQATAALSSLSSILPSGATVGLSIVIPRCGVLAAIGNR